MASPMPGSRAAVGEQALAQVLVEGGPFAVEVGDHQVGPAVAVEVAAGHAHARLVSPLGAAGHAGLESDLLEVEAALVAEQVIGSAVVGDVEVDAVVVVEIGGDDAQAAPVGLGAAGRRRDVDEPAAVVAKDMVGGRLDLAGVSSRSSPLSRSGRAEDAPGPRSCSGRRTGRGRRRCRGRRTPPRWDSRAGRPGPRVPVTSSKVPSPRLR